MTRTPLPDDALEALFAQARRADPPALPADLAARLLAQAAAAQPRPQPAPGLWSRLRAALADVGGAPGLAGLGVAGVAGLWIGVADPVGAAALVWEGAAGLSPSVAGLLESDTPFDLLPADF